MKSSNRFLVTKTIESLKKGYICSCCKKKIVYKEIEYWIEDNIDPHNMFTWVCSEECVNMYILSKI